MIYRFPLKGFFTFIRRVVQHPGMYKAIIILIASAIIQPVIGQKFPVWAADELYLKDPDYIQGENAENMSLSLNLVPLSSTDMVMPGYDNSLWQPDSVYEYHNDGYQAGYIHMYYRYGQPQFQDSIISFFYNIYGNKLPKEEYYTFDENGNLTLYLLKNEDPWGLDTNLIDYTRKEYTYEGELLIHARIRDEDPSWNSNSDHYYFYDNDGRLILDSLFIYEEFAEAHEYEYVDGDTVRYSYEKGPGYISVTGYFFEKTDTSLLTTVCQSDTYWDVDVVADSITEWYSYKYYLETIDALGRTISLSYSSEYPRWQELLPGYRAEFNYTSNGMLSYETYYNWEGSADEGSYIESTRRSYEYDAHGNLKVFVQTFWDARLESWETEIKREYFYSQVSLGIITEKKEEILHIYPNPVQDYLFIQDTFNPDFVFSVYDQFGALVLNGRMESGIIDVSDLRTGLYLITIKSGRTTCKGKFLKY